MASAAAKRDKRYIDPPNKKIPVTGEDDWLKQETLGEKISS
jgi:hypothetical protein